MPCLSGDSKKSITEKCRLELLGVNVAWVKPGKWFSFAGPVSLKDETSMVTPVRRSISYLIVIFMCLLLVSCSWFGGKKKDDIDHTQQYLEDAKEARERGPLEGDVRVMDGMEYVYGKNVRYMTAPEQPVYVWVRRDYYSPSVIDTLPGRVGSPTRTKELSKLEERLAKLEEQIEGTGAHLVHPPQPVRDAAGRTWMLYFRNDDGVKWYLDDRELPQQSPGDVIRLWRKRVFPSWAFQKEIVTLDDLDCREDEYRTRELQVAYWNGASQTSTTITPWAHIFSNSPEQYLIDTRCKFVW